MGFAIMAGALVAAGLGLEMWAIAALGWRRAFEVTDAPPDPAMPRLVFAGPFRLVRHPQSLGLLLLLVGAVLALRTVAMAAAAAAGAALVVMMALRHDRELAQRGGEAHARYRRAVPLLVPRLR